jgi:hypothetical protein
VGVWGSVDGCERAVAPCNALAAHGDTESFWAHIGRSQAACAPRWTHGCGCKVPLLRRWAPTRAGQSSGSATLTDLDVPAACTQPCIDQCRTPLH